MMIAALALAALGLISSAQAAVEVAGQLFVDDDSLGRTR
jgi:hypothetical protein